MRASHQVSADAQLTLILRAFAFSVLGSTKRHDAILKLGADPHLLDFAGRLEAARVMADDMIRLSLVAQAGRNVTGAYGSIVEASLKADGAGRA